MVPIVNNIFSEAPFWILRFTLKSRKRAALWYLQRSITEALPSALTSACDLSCKGPASLHIPKFREFLGALKSLEYLFKMMLQKL